MLLMKPDCEICHAALSHQAEAYICTYECSFCPKCAKEMGVICKIARAICKSGRKDKPLMLLKKI